MKPSIALASILLVVLTFGAARAADDLPNGEARDLGNEVWHGRPSVFKICPEHGDDQDYALCAAAQCFTIDSVAYCRCVKERGQSISLPFFFPSEGPKPVGDVCDLMENSGDGNFLVSTFSPPPQLEQSYTGPDKLAIYTCPGPDNLSAQCDGGLCFKGTSGTSWPFLGPIGEDEIVCSCPIAPAPTIGFQFIGPANCDEDFFDEYCGVTSTSTGTGLAVGAVTGSGTILTKLLQGDVPPTNRCFFPENGEASTAIRTRGTRTLPRGDVP